MSDRPDYTLPVSIEAVTIATLPIDIKTQTLGTVAIDIKSQTLSQLNVNLAASAITLNVNLQSQSVDINIKTSGGANIVIDKLTQAAYTERRSTLENNGATPLWAPATGDVRQGKFFPRGARGFIVDIDVYCKDAGTSGGTITVCISPQPSMGAVASANITVPAGGAAAWRSATLSRMWNYDSLFIWVVGSTADVLFAYDSGTPLDNFSSTNAGASWSIGYMRFWIRAVMTGETVGDLPISGTVNAVVLPTVSSRLAGASLNIPTHSETVLVEVYGAGTFLEIKVSFGVAVTPSAAVFYSVYVYCDDNLAYEVSNIIITQSLTATSGACSIGEFLQTASRTFMTVRLPLKFKRKIRVSALQTSGSAAPDSSGILVTSLIT